MTLHTVFHFNTQKYCMYSLLSLPLLIDGKLRISKVKEIVKSHTEVFTGRIQIDSSVPVLVLLHFKTGAFN